MHTERVSVSAAGHCIHGGFEMDGEEDDRDRSRAMKSKQSLLDTLLERTR